MKTKELPSNPGVYLFKDSADTIIYIGKAKNLKKRVKSYFTKSRNHSTKTQHLVTKIVHIDHIIVDNEVEALLLENKLIKKHKPKYNINLKDGRTYAYIGLSKEKYPRIFTTRKVSKRFDYIGPFTDGSARKELIDLTVKLFRLRTCRTLPKRACLNYHIGLCTAPCIKNVTEQEYQEQVESAKTFLKGDTKKTLRLLEKEMKAASKEQKYELALEKKKQIHAITYMYSKQKVDLIKGVNQDIIAMLHDNKQAVIVVFTIKKGVIGNKEDFRFEYEQDLLQDFIKMYYSTREVPHEIIINQEIDHEENQAIEKYLERMQGRKVRIQKPMRGEKKRLIELATKNARFSMENSVLKQIQERLNLPTLPRRIECFDISNLGDEHIVAGMTQWINGKPNKAGYRKFEIRETRGKQDDFAAMHEATRRRYARLQKEEQQMPDLIIIDGGPGQLNAALKSLRMLNVSIPIIGLAKKFEEIYLPEEDIPRRYNKNSPMMLLIRRIRDSVHRFVLSYNKKKREMKLREEIKRTKE